MSPLQNKMKTNRWPDYPRESDKTIDAVIADIQGHVDSPRLVLNIGAGDGYEVNRVKRVLNIPGMGVEGEIDTVISSHTGPTEFYIYHSAGLSSIHMRVEPPQETVRTISVSLDDFCWLNDINPDILMIDVEGATFDVLSGGPRVLRGVGFVFAETETSQFFKGAKLDNDVDRFLVSSGFKRLREYGHVNGQKNSSWVRADE